MDSYTPSVFYFKNWATFATGNYQRVNRFTRLVANVINHKKGTPVLELKLSHLSTNTGAKLMKEDGLLNIIQNIQGQLHSIAEIAISQAVKNDLEVLHAALKRIEERKKEVSGEKTGAYARGYISIEGSIHAAIAGRELSEKKPQESDSGLH